MTGLQLNINLNFQQLLDVVKQLSSSEKLELNNFIWDNNIEIPIEHQNLINERKNKSIENPNRLLVWDEASKTLKS